MAKSGAVHAEHDTEQQRDKDCDEQGGVKSCFRVPVAAAVMCRHRRLPV